ncbi:MULTISPECIES: GNAT family N-acetyltransferase [Vibrio]|uniref:GNAT family N-acetyltransferase n=2 Tax=Vibrio TaxID=662 RepID=A0A7X4LJS0_9VIBR|nr:MULTISPECIES: GNAT family N-acetyltransferase [Vibrio]MBF9002354.1 GNAT family N-acetyltransferase [Vibrio nitrifigilis]MZI93065.1 GNAT family N-acetyltransferase [Vibrio eleionomae]
MEISLLAEHPHCVPEIAQWYFTEWASKSPTGTLEKVIVDVKARSENRDKLPLSYIGLQNGVLAGVVELKFREHKKYPEYEHWLGGVYVKSDFRKQGVAKAIIVKALSHADSLGISELYLQTEEKNVSLYAQFGFKELHKAELGITIMVRLKKG